MNIEFFISSKITATPSESVPVMKEELEAIVSLHAMVSANNTQKKPLPYMSTEENPMPAKPDMATLFSYASIILLGEGKRLFAKIGDGDIYVMLHDMGVLYRSKYDYAPVSRLATGLEDGDELCCYGVYNGDRELFQYGSLVRGEGSPVVTVSDDNPTKPVPISSEKKKELPCTSAELLIKAIKKSRKLHTPCYYMKDGGAWNEDYIALEVDHGDIGVYYETFSQSELPKQSRHLILMDVMCESFRTDMASPILTKEQLSVVEWYAGLPDRN